MSNRTHPKSSRRPSTHLPQFLNNNSYVTNSPPGTDTRRNARGRRNNDERRYLLSSFQSVPQHNPHNVPRGDLISQSTDLRGSGRRRPLHTDSEPDIGNEIHNPSIEYLEVDSDDGEAVSEDIDVIEVSVNQDRPVEPGKHCRWIYIYRWKIISFMILYILLLATTGFGVSLYNLIHIPQEFAQDCAEINNLHQRGSGVYHIYIDGKEVPVYCDMNTDGGGWMVIQRRIDATTDFYKSFKFYHQGFGDVKRNYWFGLFKLYVVTSRKKYKLRIDMKDFDDNSYNATYDVFSVGSHSTSHTLTIDGFSGDLAGDALSCNNQMAFVAYDSSASNQCADQLRGGWWYSRNNSNCGCSNLNGHYFDTNQHKRNGIWWGKQDNVYQNLRHVEMKIRSYEM